MINALPAHLNDALVFIGAFYLAVMLVGVIGAGVAACCNFINRIRKP